MLGRLRDKLGGGIRTGLKEAVLGAAHSVRGGTTAAPPDPVPLRTVPSAPTPLRPSPPRTEPAPVSRPLAPVVTEVVADPPPLVVEAAPPVVAEAPPPVVAAPPVVEEPAALAEPELTAPVEPTAAEEPAPVTTIDPPVAEAKPTSLAAAALAASGAVERKILHADMGSTDVESYRKRAIASGRDPATVVGKPGMNRAADGEAFWDPVDNESARAKAGGRVLTVDQWECISCGTCVEQTDKVFVLPPDGKAAPIAQEGPMDLIQDAIEACPVTCIHWVTPEEAQERGLATGMD